MPTFAARLALFSLLLGLFPVSSLAEVLQLANGDRLQGRLIARKNGTIRWESPILGIITVAETQAGVVPDAASPPSAIAAGAPAVTFVIPPSPPKPKAERWKSKIESGFTLQSGRSNRTDVNLRFETALERQHNSYLVQGRYLYSKAAGATTNERTEGAVRWRRELATHWFGQSNTSYLAAKIRGIEHNAEQNFGLGYRLFKTPRGNASVGAGVTGQYRELRDAGTGRSLFGEFFQDFALKLSPWLELGQEAKAQYSPDGRGLRLLPNGQVRIIDTEFINYKFTFNSFLRGKFTETLSLALRYEYEFDNTYEGSRSKSDQRVTTSLGYTF